MCVCTGPEDTDSSENKGAAAERPSAAVLGVLERSSELMELLTNMATITNLLSQAAQSRLNKQDQQVQRASVSVQSLIYILLPLD